MLPSDSLINKILTVQNKAQVTSVTLSMTKILSWYDETGCQNILQVLSFPRTHKLQNAVSRKFLGIKVTLFVGKHSLIMKRRMR